MVPRSLAISWLQRYWIVSLSHCGERRHCKINGGLGGVQNGGNIGIRRGDATLALLVALLVDNGRRREDGNSIMNQSLPLIGEVALLCYVSSILFLVSLLPGMLDRGGLPFIVSTMAFLFNGKRRFLFGNFGFV